MGSALCVCLLILFTAEKKLGGTMIFWARAEKGLYALCGQPVLLMAKKSGKPFIAVDWRLVIHLYSEPLLSRE